MNPLQERASQFEAEYNVLCLKYGMHYKAVIQSERPNDSMTIERAALIIEVVAPSETPQKEIDGE